MAYNVLDIANKILAKPNSEYEELISNMKLQKLLYLCRDFILHILVRHYLMTE